MGTALYFVIRDVELASSRQELLAPTHHPKPLAPNEISPKLPVSTNI